MHTSFRPDDASPIDAREAGFVTRNRRVLIAVVLLAVAVAAYFIFGRNTAEEKPAEAQAPTVTVVVPGRATVAATVTASGSIGARREMPVGVQGEGGMVTAVLVDAGDFVRAGEVLARIDRAVQLQQFAQMQAQVNVARADARLAQSELDRAKTLVDKGFISKADIDRRTATRDSANARAASAAAQAREMSARLARLDVRAPSAGLVLSRAVEPGQIVGAGGQPLFRIAQNGEMEMEARVAEQDMAKLRSGVAAKVTPVGSSRSVNGRIWLLEPTIDPNTRQGKARIALPRDPSIRVGGFANASIVAGSAVQPVLPQSAVLADAKGSYVLIVGPGNAVARRDIKVGDVGESGISVVSGLSGTERVVFSAGAFLNPGEKVSPVVQATR